MKRYLLLFSIILFFNSSVWALNPADSLKYPKLNWQYVFSFPRDSKKVLKAPFHWQTKQWITAGAVMGAGVLAYTQDEKIQRWFVSHRSPDADNLSKYVFEPFGNGKGTLLVIGSLYVGGRIAKSDRLSGTALTAFKAVFIATTAAGIIKQVAHRHRPYQDAIPDKTNWDGPFANIRYTSFPSQHSTAAFSLATVIASEYKETVWVPVLAYTLAAGTAVSRLYDNKHWASDVIIGSALGYGVGKLIWKLNSPRAKKITVTPQITPFGTVLGVNMAF